MAQLAAPSLTDSPHREYTKGTADKTSKRSGSSAELTRRQGRCSTAGGVVRPCRIGVIGWRRPAGAQFR